MTLKIGRHILTHTLLSISENIDIESMIAGNGGEPRLMIDLENKPEGESIAQIFGYLRESNEISVIDSETGIELAHYDNYDRLTNLSKMIEKGRASITITLVDSNQMNDK